MTSSTEQSSRRWPRSSGGRASTRSPWRTSPTRPSSARSPSTGISPPRTPSSGSTTPSGPTTSSRRWTASPAASGARRGNRSSRYGALRPFAMSPPRPSRRPSPVGWNLVRDLLGQGRLDEARGPERAVHHTTSVGVSPSFAQAFPRTRLAPARTAACGVSVLSDGSVGGRRISTYVVFSNLLRQRSHRASSPRFPS